MTGNGIFLSALLFSWIKYSEPRLILHVVLVHTSGDFQHPSTKLLRLGILMIQGRDHVKNVDFGSSQKTNIYFPADITY